jgi:hypothetical protein
MKRVCFVVAERPRCIWVSDPIARNVEFLQNVDPGYFEYLAKVHEEKLTGNDRMAAAISLRSAYFQGLETLFAFLCATIQSPQCVFGWLESYTNIKLREIVERVSQGHDVKTVMPERPITWESLSRRIHAGVISDDEEKQAQLVAGYAHVWRQFASDLLDTNIQKEYNCIKHGFRAKSTGFTVKFGDSSFAGSDYGSRFFAVEKIGNDSHNFFVHQHGINWSPIKLVDRLHLVSASVSNVINRLLLWFGQPITPDEFKYPADFGSFRSPWDDGIQATAVDIRHGFKESSIRLLTNAQILDEYRQWSLQDAPEADGNAGSGPARAGKPSAPPC